MPETKASIELSGLNFDDVWENIIKKIECGEWNNDLTLEEKKSKKKKVKEAKEADDKEKNKEE